MKQHIWVIEMYDKGKWLPTTGVDLTRANAREQKRVPWERRCPIWKFRIRKYVREPERRFLG